MTVAALTVKRGSNVAEPSPQWIRGLWPCSAKLEPVQFRPTV